MQHKFKSQSNSTVICDDDYDDYDREIEDDLDSVVEQESRIIGMSLACGCQWSSPWAVPDKVTNRR